MVTEVSAHSSIEGKNHQRFYASTPIQAYARITGVLLLLSVLAGFFGELYVPSKLIVSNDAAATANNFLAHDSLFRLEFANYLLEAVCDVALSLLFVVLLRPVNTHLAWLTAFFGLVSTATFAVAKLFYFTASFIFENTDQLTAFSPDQVNAIALLSLKVYGYGGELFMVFYGVSSYFLLPMLVAMLSLASWLIIRGVHVPKWQEKAAVSE